VAALLLLCGTFVTSTAAPQDAAVRASLSSDDPVWVGQRVTLVVELLAPGYFASAVNFDLPDPEGVLLMPPAGSPLVSNETIGDTMYTVQRHEVSVWPMRAGAQIIPAVTARFSFKRNPLDRDEVPASVTTEPVQLTIALPPGAENLGTVISARGLKVEESWKPEPGAEDVLAGAAFTRTITFTAPNVPGMIFPPFPAGEIDGLGIYPKRQLLDRQERGSLVGVRRDQITYVCQRPGQFTVPAARFTWFDLEAKKLRTEDLPARTLTVLANTAMASAAAHTAADTAARPWHRGSLMGGSVLLLGLLLAALSNRGRRFLARCMAPFRPVRLQPLNPSRPPA
jgi:hypothetical protein